MTCLEAQSNIMAFIDKKLPEDEASDFVRHMKYCHNCYEELEIYYTLIVGMRQLDNDKELSQDFHKDLKQELDRLENKAKVVKRFKLSGVGVIVILLVAFGWLFYNAALSKVYDIEQRIIKQSQGETFNYDYFGEYIELSNRDLISENQPVIIIKKEPTMYERIHLYNLEHKDDAYSEQEDENTGEDNTL